MSPELRLKADLTIALGRRAESRLQFRLGTPSRRLAICGPSGVGKSTFLKILAGAETRARGCLHVNGECWQDSSRGIFRPSADRRVGWVPQNSLLFPHLSVRGNLSFGRRSPDETALLAMAEALHITPLLDRAPRNLSGGEAQRVALGRALLAEPRLLLLDEPLSALNDSLRAEVLSFLARHTVMNEIALVLATHRRSEATVLCEEVVDWGDPADFRKAPAPTQRVRGPLASRPFPINPQDIP